jgi:hypothetical protein
MSPLCPSRFSQAFNQLQAWVEQPHKARQAQQQHMAWVEQSLLALLTCPGRFSQAFTQLQAWVEQAHKARQAQQQDLGARRLRPLHHSARWCQAEQQEKAGRHLQQGCPWPGQC